MGKIEIPLAPVVLLLCLHAPKGYFKKGERGDFDPLTLLALVSGILTGIAGNLLSCHLAWANVAFR